VTDNGWTSFRTTIDDAGTGDVLLSTAFTEVDVPDLRHRCLGAALAAGLTQHRALMFVYAVDVAVHNSLRCHGRGVLRLLRNGRAHLVAEVVDNRDDDDASSRSTHGLWLAERLVDDLTLRPGPEGTTTRVAMALGGPHSDVWAGSRSDSRLAPIIAGILFPNLD
jgi:hypothetical protein